MADQTPRFGLGTYSEGETDWTHTDTVEKLDEAAIERGPIADRPDQGSYDDELYLATDQRIIWRWDVDAADWVAVSGLGSDSQAVPGTSHFESVRTESSRTKTLQYDYSEDWPHSPRQPEQSSMLILKEHPAAQNPVLHPDDATDHNSSDIADPFIAIDDDGVWHMFFETMNQDVSGGEAQIGCAKSIDGVNWEYNALAIGTGRARSYPFVFKWDGTWYLTAEGQYETHAIWEATDFPTDWTVAEELFGTGRKEPNLFRWDGRWWFFLDYPQSDSDDHHLEIYYSEQTDSGPVGRNWTEHPDSMTVTGDPARWNGRPIVYESYIDIWTQPNVTYRRITELTTDTYEAEVVAGDLTDQAILPRRTSNGSWNDSNMHHMDPIMAGGAGRDVVAVDGHDGSQWSIGIYSSTDDFGGVARFGPTSTITAASGDFTDIQLDERHHDHETPGQQVASNDKYFGLSSGYYEIKAKATVEPTSAPTGNYEIRLRLNMDNRDPVEEEFAIGPDGVTVPQSITVEWQGYLNDPTNGIKAQLWHDADVDLDILDEVVGKVTWVSGKKIY